MIATQTDQVTVADYDLDQKRNPIPVLFSGRSHNWLNKKRKEATKQVKHVLINTSHELQPVNNVRKSSEMLLICNDLATCFHPEGHNSFVPESGAWVGGRVIV